MMDKETLQKKIESGDTVWTLRYGKIIPVKINFTNTKYGVDYEFVWGNSPDVDGSEIYETKYLFATKEDAEWEAEFGNVTRTEKLVLPTWNKIWYEMDISNGDNVICIFNAKDGAECMLSVVDFGDDDFYDWTIVLEKQGKEIYDFDYTHDGYLKACRICNKLFLGEEL